MIAAAILILLAPPPSATASPARQLDEVARIASVMVDGDVARRIQTQRSLAAMLEKNPADRFAASDNYDVDEAAFIATKKTLMRLARLCPGACDVNLWMPLPGEPPAIQLLVRNVNEMSQFWTFGALRQEMPPEMKRVLATGERVTVMRRAGMISVLAPVFDSLRDIVALVEVVSSGYSESRSR